MKFFLAALLAPVAFALPATIQTRSPVPASPLEQRQSCAASCGSSACYYSSTVNTAVSAGCQRYKQNNPVNSYPHTYNNYEGFDFAAAGPYQEFPILRNYNNNPYTGGSPGPDRVVFTTSCQLAGVITHDGASGNAFVECSDSLAMSANESSSSGSGTSGTNGTSSGNNNSSDQESAAASIDGARIWLGFGRLAWNLLLDI